jgi:hypothetical protein
MVVMVLLVGRNNRGRLHGCLWVSDTERFLARAGNLQDGFEAFEGSKIVQNTSSTGRQTITANWHPLR